jgi:hypothetical protein
MKRLQLLFLALFVALSMGIPLLSPAIARAQDTEDVAPNTDNTQTTVADVGKQVDLLWKYVDDNASKPDKQFYPGFVEQATQAEERISDVYNNLQIGIVTDQSSAIVATIKEDIGKIRDQIEVWRQTAIDQDSDKFETANDDLGTLVDTYNSDIDAYNHAQSGDRTMGALTLYAGVPAVLFMLICGLLAWAWIKNDKDGNVAGEILRRIRWYMVYAAGALLLASGIPYAFYFWTQKPITYIYWLPASLMLLALLGMVGWYIKIRLITKRRPLQE